MYTYHKEVQNIIFPSCHTPTKKFQKLLKMCFVATTELNSPTQQTPFSRPFWNSSSCMPSHLRNESRTSRNVSSCSAVSAFCFDKTLQYPKSAVPRA